MLITIAAILLQSKIGAELYDDTSGTTVQFDAHFQGFSNSEKMGKAGQEDSCTLYGL